jgi:hypothetical protein
VNKGGEMKKLLRQALNAHSNIYVFASIVSILEGGCIASGVDSNDVAQTIIDLCKDEQQRLLKLHDEALAKLSEGGA